MDRKTIILIVAILLGLIISFFLGEGYGAKKGIETMKPDTVTVTKWIRDTIYEPKDSFIVKWKPVYLPVHDTIDVHDTTKIRDSILVDVPITEKTYEGEYYHAVIKGFQPELVEMWIKQKETKITVPYRKRWSFTVGPQVGVGYTPEGFQPYAGVGLTFGYTF